MNNDIGLQRLVEKAKSGAPLYITQLHEMFASMEDEECNRIVLEVERLECTSVQSWELKIPSLSRCLLEDEKRLLHEYLYAEIYNIISSLGGKSMTLYVDPENKEIMHFARQVQEVFCIPMQKKDRKGYGRAVNVLDRMLAAVYPDLPPFYFKIRPIQEYIAKNAPKSDREEQKRAADGSIFIACTKGLEKKSFCGIDIGGTNIKAVVVYDGIIIGYKEYNWFPASFKLPEQITSPILMLVELLQACLWVNVYIRDSQKKATLLEDLSTLLKREAGDDAIWKFLTRVRNEIAKDKVLFDGIGICFPDVCVHNKIVGGEVYKTRGIRNNSDIDYEKGFALLTDLDEYFIHFVKPDGSIKIINDGSMAAFTAAVEMSAMEIRRKEVAEHGIFAHTLGTELGTGWVTCDGTIPDIPLEVYNYIIDLGSWPERDFESDDVRSINNFNTGLPGTLQKYCSQSGVFRLAIKYFKEFRSDLLKEIVQNGFIVQKYNGHSLGWYVPTEPFDMRKPFLEFLMTLPDREDEETIKRIWKEIGEFLAVTALECERILKTGIPQRFLFGGMVISETCFRLMQEGFSKNTKEFSLIAASSDLAYTPLMKQLETDPKHAIAQYALAVGAVYFANAGLITPSEES
jgi:hypothetical protein